MSYFSSDASQVSFQRSGTNAAVRSVLAQLQDQGISILSSVGVDATGSADSSAGINSALAQGGFIFCPPGTYTINSDLLYYSNTTFWVMRGATLNFNASRFTPANASVVNVSLIVDGVMTSANLSTNAPQKFSWPSDTGGVGPTTTYERGFIEFGGASGASRSPGGFYVGGHGTISGDWTGTPSITNLWTGDLCRKGVAAFFCDNVLVENVNVYGFHGEAVYHYDSTSTVNNVIFQDLYVHDTNFNALNFNHLSEARNCYIRNNTTYNSYQGIEISAGIAHDNTIRLTQGPGILTGGGTVQTVFIHHNLVDSAQMDGIQGIASTSNTGTGDITINDNIVLSAQGNGVIGGGASRFTARDNRIYSYGTTAGSFGVAAQSTCTYADIRGNSMLAPNAGVTAPVRNQATYATTKNNVYYDTSTSAPVPADTASYLTTAQTTEYKVIDGVGAAGVGHSVIHKIGGALPLAAQQNYARVYSSVDATGATGASGSFHVATKKTGTESTTLSDTMVFDQNGNALVTSAGGLGYGTGSGGTVTQATNKSTTVTLNAPCGQITMNNAALAAGAAIAFTLNNSAMTANDVLVTSINSNSPNAGSYSVRGLASAVATIIVTNTSGGSLSDAVVINFAVIKGATA